jgi:hypothetical protein
MMLQFAFGPGPTNARSSRGPAAHAGGNVECEPSPQMLALVAAARAWWESGRPEGWSLEEHLADPAVGCDGSQPQRALAEAIACWVKQGC